MPASDTTFKQIVRNFSGGLQEDRRVQNPSGFALTKHFDAFTYPMKLVPYAKTISSLGLSGGVVTTLKIVKFLYCATSNGFFRMFGLGQDGSGVVQVYKFDIDAGTPNTSLWNIPANGNAGAALAGDPNVFFYYKGFIFMYAAGTNVLKMDATEVAGFNNNYQTISYTNGGVQPVHHPSDDIAYFFDDHNVYSLNATVWSTVLTLPSDQFITCACAFGDYLAIGTTTSGTVDVHSYVYLWDRDSSLTTLTDRYDFGSGSLVHLASLDNRIIAVMNFYISNLYSLSKPKVIIKTVNGQFGVPIGEIISDGFLGILPRGNVLKENKLYFLMSMPLYGDKRLGVWAVDSNGRFTLDTYEPLFINAIGLFPIANSWWLAEGSGGSYQVTHSDQNGAYSSTNPSVWETLIFNTLRVTSRGTVIGNSMQTKKLIGASLSFEALTSGQSVTLKYRTDSNVNDATKWVTIFTFNTVGQINHSAVNIESTGGPLGNYKEIQFRTESLGGAIVTGLQYGGEIIDDDKY